VEEAYALVLDAADGMAELCGSNDANLKELENLLGARVFCRGNELFMEGSDENRRELFRRMVGELSRHAAEGECPTPALVRALYDSLAGAQGSEAAQAADSFRESFIQIPGGFSRVYPKGKRQAAYVAGMASSDIAFSVGPAGTGKTFLAVAFALRELLTRQKRKLVLTRPVVEAGESLGFLPGDLAQKINPYLRPLYDAMEALIPFETLRRLEDNRAIEIAPLAYMRGRSLNNCMVILDEGQNTTKEQMKMFLTRLGEGSKAVITGDITQIDLPRKQESGLVHALAVLSRIPGISMTRLDRHDVVRHPLIKEIIKAYDEAEE
jgi:phosphate starvation-inducible protein PhoH and related proteins